ncbi:MAG: hypothetical protein QOH73_1809 [Gaiellaceae bacterium]|nr:hypothetical protein [Gaiellaceae bacterium]
MEPARVGDASARAQSRRATRELQFELHHEQRAATSEMKETKRTVERVAEQTERRRRMPRVSLTLER